MITGTGVHDRPESAFTIDWNECSRSTGIGVHDPPERAFLLSSVYAEQFQRYRDALRLAGERDHVDEDVDFGVPADGVLHSEVAGRTPKEATGVRTIRTTDLVPFLATTRPVVVDTVLYSWNRSISGAGGCSSLGWAAALPTRRRIACAAKFRS